MLRQSVRMIAFDEIRRCLDDSLEHPAGVPNLIFFIVIRLQTEILQVISQMHPLILAEYAHGEADQGPQVNRVIVALEMVGQIVNLRMAIMAGSDTIIGSCRPDLVELNLPICSAFFFSAGL